MACRKSHPHLAADISSALHHTSALWQKALAVIRQYAQVARDVSSRVLPDLTLAVQEAEPNLAIDLLEVVQGWTSQMRADGEAAQNLCMDLSQRLCDLIAKAQGERLLASAPAAKDMPALPAVDPDARISEAATMEQPAAEQTAVALPSGGGSVNRATKELFDGLACFANSVFAADAKGAEAECSKRDLIDLLFLAPGAVHGAAKPAIAQTLGGASSAANGRTTTGASEDANMGTPNAGGGSEVAEAGDAEMVDTEQSPRTATGAALMQRDVDMQWDLAHPLLKATRELRRVSQILLECMSFWTNMNGTVQELGRLKEHTASLVKYASKSSNLRARFESRLSEYSEFWAFLMKLCEQYCAEAEPELAKVRALINKVEDAADKIEFAGSCPMASERVLAMRS